MQGEIISIETLRMYQEIEKENKELQEKNEKLKEKIKKLEQENSVLKFTLSGHFERDMNEKV